MRITIIAPGSRGDVQPYLALAKGLKRAGHSSRLVTHENFDNFVTAHGVEFWPVEGNVQTIAQSRAMRSRLEKGNFLAILSQMAKEAKHGALALTEAGLAACRDVDLVIAGLGGLFTAVALSDALGIPVLQAYYIPFTPTRAYPSFIVPDLPLRTGGILNRASYTIARQMIWQGFRSGDRLARQKILDLPPAPFWGPFNTECLQETPILYGYSPSVIPKAPDWSEDTHVTGYWFLDPLDAWTPPNDLMEFLHAGSPPLYVGFGSMSSRDPEATAAIVLEALDRTHQRAVVLSGWGGLQMTNAPETVYPIDSVPFSWLFPRMAAVVHHGGAGTTSAGLRAGVPSIVVPFFGDQPFWGKRIADLGVGPDPIPRRKLTASRLAQAIRDAVTCSHIRERAADLGARIQAEDGVSKAVTILEQFYTSYRK